MEFDVDDIRGRRLRRRHSEDNEFEDALAAAEISSGSAVAPAYPFSGFAYPTPTLQPPLNGGMYFSNREMYERVLQDITLKTAHQLNESNYNFCEAGPTAEVSETWPESSIDHAAGHSISPNPEHNEFDSSQSDSVKELSYVEMIEEIFKATDLDGIKKCVMDLAYKVKKMEERCERTHNRAYLSKKRGDDFKEDKYQPFKISIGKWVVDEKLGLKAMDLQALVAELKSDGVFTGKKSTADLVRVVTRYFINRIVPSPDVKKYGLRLGSTVKSDIVDFPHQVIRQIVGLHAEACALNSTDKESMRNMMRLEEITRRAVRTALEDLRRTKRRVPANAARRNAEEGAPASEANETNENDEPNDDMFGTGEGGESVKSEEEDVFDAEMV